MASRVIPVPPFTLAVFGAAGDLARRKLYPALWRRLLAGQMPMESRIVGVGRGQLSEEEFRALILESLQKADAADGRNDVAANAKLAEEWTSRLRYVAQDVSSSDGWDSVAATMRAGPSPQIIYLALSPTITEAVCAQLRKINLLGEGGRLVLEKPFGDDLQSARRLNEKVRAAADERDVYRIDHYLGKETVQNLMALRFANGLFEPLWNARAIDHVQITVAESVGAGGRGDYYDRAGAVRDMLQNHLLQLLCLTAMESPARFAADEVRDEKLKVLKSLRPLSGKELENDAVAGQYAAGNAMQSYREDIGGDSNTATFIAAKCAVDNGRWAGTPFYLRTGKRLSARMSEVAVFFRPLSHSIFSAIPPPPQNMLALRLQPRESITMQVNIKDPGPGGFRLTAAPLDMSFADALGAIIPDAYERLLMDVVRGDQTLFMRADELEAAWQWVDPVVQHAERHPPAPYMAGSAGPDDAMRLIHIDGRRWRDIQ